MALTLAQFRTKVLQLLDDASLTRYTNALVDEALKSALEQYSLFFPLVKSYSYDATGQYRETLDTDFIATAIKAIELWPVTIGEGVPTIVEQIPFYAYMLDEQWVFETKSRLITLGRSLYIIYETIHTIDTLDTGSTATTVPDADVQLIAIGAAGHASLMRANSQIEANNLNTDEAQFLLSTSSAWLSEFNARLAGDSLLEVAMCEKLAFRRNQNRKSAGIFTPASWHNPDIDTNY